MADGDSYKDKVKRSLFPTKRTRTPKPKINEKWYRKDPKTINIKLRQAIIDALPFDIDNKQADLILRTIFESITRGVVEDGFTTIVDLGQFYPQKRAGRWFYWSKKASIRGPYIGGKEAGRKFIPEHYRLAFKPCRSLRTSMADEDVDGDSGKSQGT